MGLTEVLPSRRIVGGRSNSIDRRQDRTRPKKCSQTLRHRDNMHISLSRPGGMGRTSWYDGRLGG